MKSIELDIAYEEPTELIRLTQNANNKNITLEVVEESANFNGGWPVVKFTGDGQDLMEFLDSNGIEFEADWFDEVTS